MDRRMYRGNMGNNCGCNKNMPPYKASEPVCGDLLGGYKPEDMHERCGHEHEHEHEHEDHFDRFPIGMCYVPWQQFRNLYENEFVALANGTLFKELDLDWYGRGCK